MLFTGAVFLHFFLFHQTAAAAEVEKQQMTLVGEKGRSILLPCLERPSNSTLKVTRWKKSGLDIVTRDYSQPSHSSSHFTVLDDGSLNITGLLSIDEDVYECDPTPKNDSISQSILLQVADGPGNMTIDIKPASRLANGTLYVQKDDNVSFHCSSNSDPSQNLTWFFEDVSRGFGSSSSLSFQISSIQPSDQGSYTCKAQNLLSNRTVEQSQDLLVYYASERHPDCTWQQVGQPDLVNFSCFWYGNYPLPILQVFLDSEPDIVLGTGVTEKIEVTLNRKKLKDGQKITCKGRHIEILPGQEKSCLFELQSPYPMGEPMVTALEGSNITFSCHEDKSLPPAKTVWQLGKTQEVINASSKYIMTVQGPVLTLTIVHVTKTDEGAYYCLSENVLGVKELEVFLTVRSSPDSSGVVVGVFISVLIVAAGIILGLLAYSRRDRICLSFRLNGFEEDRTDVMSLVESDDDDIFHEAVPRLPPVSNGHAPVHSTTFVQIHRIQSSDHEDNVNDADKADQDLVNLGA